MAWNWAVFVRQDLSMQSCYTPLQASKLKQEFFIDTTVLMYPYLQASLFVHVILYAPWPLLQQYEAWKLTMHPFLGGGPAQRS
eukprot:841708-Pelagomonas_calceolata.AAC.2